MSSPTQKIFDASTESLYEFVSKNGRGLYIPPYQREYAWDKSNAERLIADTLQGLSAMFHKPDQALAFIGTIIAINDAKKSLITPLVKTQVYGQVMTIIDGQQRLSTLLMLSLTILTEVETLWKSIKQSKSEALSEDAIAWLETRVNDVRGRLAQLLAERQNNGDGPYRYFPKMIRSLKDTWSYEKDKACYESPIAWILFEYLKLHCSEKPNWSRFFGQLATSASQDQGKLHCLKIMKAMQKRLKRLPELGDFPELRLIISDLGKQEAFFGDTIPDALARSVEKILRQNGRGIVVGDDEELEVDIEDNGERRYWSDIIRLMHTLVFANFFIDRITLVVVTATTEDFAFDVFEALNSTGQPLTALETFVPRVVQSVGLSAYDRSAEKAHLDRAQQYLRSAASSEQRQKRSAELVVSFALAESGQKRSKSLSDQRSYMREAYDACVNSSQRQNFVAHLSDLAAFFDKAWQAGQVPELAKSKLSDQARLCLAFLNDLGHTITVPLLVQYASSEVKVFEDALKAVTAFAVFWRASRTSTDSIDQVYRDFMHEGDARVNLPPLARAKRGDAAPPDVTLLRRALLARLTRSRQEGGGGVATRQEWVERTAKQPLYDVSRPLARFVLLAALHDTIEVDGQLKVGKKTSQSMLTYAAWMGDAFKTIEHIAPQTRDEPSDWPEELYSEDQFERLGNLTLLPLNANQSLNNRNWKEKRVMLAALAAKTEADANRILTDAGMAVNGRIYGGSYLPFVHVLLSHESWTSEVVESRGRQLAGFAWDRLSPWIGWDV